MKTLNSRLKAWLQTHRDGFDAFSEAILDMQILIMTTTAAAASYIAFLYFAYSLSHTLGIDSDHIATAMFMGLILAFVLLAFIAPFKTIFTFVVWAGCLPAAIQIPFLTQRFGDDYSRTAALGLLIIIGLYGAIRGVQAYPKMKEERARVQWLTALVHWKYPGFRKWRAMLKADMLTVSEAVEMIRMRYGITDEDPPDSGIQSFDAYEAMVKKMGAERKLALMCGDILSKRIKELFPQSRLARIYFLSSGWTYDFRGIPKGAPIDQLELTSLVLRPVNCVAIDDWRTIITVTDSEKDNEFSAA